jgi:hypothetical protein
MPTLITIIALLLLSAIAQILIIRRINKKATTHIQYYVDRFGDVRKLEFDEMDVYCH